jgi:hypothetical protein
MILETTLMHESINASEILLRLLWREVLLIHLPAMHCLEQDLEIAEFTKAKEPPKVIGPFARSFGKQLSLLLGRGRKLVVRNPCSFICVLFAILFGLCVGTIFLNTLSRCGRYPNSSWICLHSDYTFVYDCILISNRFKLSRPWRAPYIVIARQTFTAPRPTTYQPCSALGPFCFWKRHLLSFAVSF